MIKEKIRVVQFGCGPIGCSVARLVLQRPSLSLVGAVDPASDKVGKDLGELMKGSSRLGIKVSPNLQTAVSAASADVALHCTSSQINSVLQQLQELIESGCDVVSTCEELSFPFSKNPSIASNINQMALDHGVTVLATGINPGFLMDAWPLFMSGLCQKIDLVKAVRVQDASLRRLSFQRKIGVGCSVLEFQALVESGKIGHVGLQESISMIADGMGWRLDRLTENIEAVIAEEAFSSDFISIITGQVAGVRQTARGFVNGRVRIILEFQAYIGAHEAYDEVRIHGVPNIYVKIQGGINGDLGTAAVVVNSIPRVVQANPGLTTVKDLSMAICYD